MLTFGTAAPKLNPSVVNKNATWFNKRLEAVKFGFEKKRTGTILVAKTKALISCAVTAQLICAFVFAYANCQFSYIVTKGHSFFLFLL